MRPLAAQAALARLPLHRNRPLNRRPGRPNLPGQVEHPGTQLLAIVDPVPRAVAQDGLPIATEKKTTIFIVTDVH